MDFALDRGDLHRVKQLLGSGPLPQFPGSAVILARAGLLAEAEQLLRPLEKKKFSPEWQLHWGRAELALARGQPEKAVAWFEEAARSQPRRPDYPVLFYESTFAQAYEQKGDLPKAIQILEDASKEKTWGAVWGVNIPMLWMGWQSDLARLYRKAGREKEAEKIEAELSKLMVYADADHPIARQLKESRAVSAQRR